MKKLILIGLLFLSLVSYSQNKEITLRTDNVLLKDTNLELNFSVYWHITNTSLIEFYPAFNKTETFPILRIVENNENELSFYVTKKGRFVKYTFYVKDKVLHVTSVKEYGTTIVTYDYY